MSGAGDGSGSTGSVVRLTGDPIRDEVSVDGVEAEWECERVTGPEAAVTSGEDGRTWEVSAVDGVRAGASIAMRSLDISDLCLLEMDERRSVANVTLVEVMTFFLE